MKLYSTLFLGCALLSGCTRTQQPPTRLPPNFQPDVSALIHYAYETNQPSSDTFSETPLGKTGFRATLSAKRYPGNLDYWCLVSVEHGEPDDIGGKTLCFRRQFSVPGHLEIKRAADAVQFDWAQGKVTFNLGVTNYTHTLPTTQ
jgi:hypothetical protein